MSRSGYSDDWDDQWGMICYRGAVQSALRGKRGQALLHDLRAGLDALPSKRLCANELVSADGDYCALGMVGMRRGIDMSQVDPDDASTVAGMLNVAEALAREVVYVNDEEGRGRETPEDRWQRVSRWVDACLKAASR